MALLYATLLVIHVLLFVYWLGSDLGVFYSAGFLARPELPPATRATVLKILHWLDLWPRLALILMIPVGSSLALLSGYAVLPGNVQPVVLAIIWVAALGWMAMALRIHMYHTVSLVPFDLTVRIAVIAALVVLAGSSFAGYGPVTTNATWLAAKLLVYAYVILCGLGIRLTFRSFGPAYGKLMREGSTLETEAAIRRAIVRSRIPALALWSGVIVEGILGLTKPF